MRAFRTILGATANVFGVLPKIVPNRQAARASPTWVNVVASSRGGGHRIPPMHEKYWVFLPSEEEIKFTSGSPLEYVFVPAN